MVHNHKCCETYKEYVTEICIHVESWEDALEDVLGVARISLVNWWVNLVLHFYCVTIFSILFDLFHENSTTFSNNLFW